jgi:protein-disulfide isomerase
VKNTLLVAAVVIALTVAILVVRTQGNAGQGAFVPTPVAKQAAPTVDDGIERFDIPVTDAQPQQGLANAPITIVEFADFQCPFCSAVEVSLREVKQAYGDKVRIVWRNQPLPIHSAATPAAEAALEAFAQGGNDKFWALHDKLFEQRDHLTRAELEQYASEVGLDVAGFKHALDKHVHAAAIESDVTLARTMAVRGTPDFFINGRRLTGSKPTVAFRELIDDELPRVEKLRASGTAADQVYATLMRNAKKTADAGKKENTVPSTVYKIPVSANDPQQGPQDGLVTLVMFGDFEDKYTKRAAETVNRLRAKYHDELRVVWKELPLAFHDHAFKAATLAREAFVEGGSSAFWEAHAMLLANQDKLTDADLMRYGAELGLDAQKLQDALTTDKYGAEFEQTKALVPRMILIYTTPLFTINGRFIRGAESAQLFESVIEQELAKAKQLVASGTPKRELYERITRDGRTEDAELTPEQKAIAHKVYDVALRANAPSKGAAKAEVVIQEFADFQCPFCTRAEPVIAALLREYEGKVRVVWRDLPLAIHADADLAAQAAREVQAQGKDAKFWKYHDLLFQHQNALSRADLEKYAQSLGGIDMARFKRALDTGKHAAAVKADAEAFARTGAKQGTPGFFINGRLIEGAMPIEFFRPVINRELAASK